MGFKKLLFIMLLFFINCLQSVSIADAKEELVARLPQDEINITARYHGERLMIYGMVPKDADIIVVVTSPKETLGMNLKGKVGPFWMAVGDVHFENVPSMYKVNSTSMLNEILPLEEQERLGIGYNGLKKQIAKNIDEGLFNEFVKLKEDERLYRVREGEIKIYKDKLFETYFYWPPKAPEGKYNIEVYAVRKGRIILHDTETVAVEKVGIEAFISNLARNYGVIYGVLAITIALGSGFAVGILFRGGGAH